MSRSVGEVSSSVSTTLQSEQFETLAGLAKAGLPIPPKAIIQASSLRNKDQILDEMEEGKQIPPQIQKQMTDMQKALQDKDQEIQAMKLQLANKQGELQLKSQALDVQKAKVMVDAHKGQATPDDPNAQAVELGLTHAQTVKTMADAQQTLIENDRLKQTPIQKVTDSVSE